MPAEYGYLFKDWEGTKEQGERAVEVITDIIQWGREKGLDDPKAQLNKVIEEVGEIAHEICRNHYNSKGVDQPDAVYDAIGDSFVTLLILADILNMDPITCMEVAYQEIKDRKGETKDGCFVKQ